MKSQYPMTTHNHNNFRLEYIQRKSRKVADAFPPFTTYNWQLPRKQKKLIILQTSDVHSRIEPMTQEGDRNYGQGGFVRRASFLQQFRKEKFGCTAVRLWRYLARHSLL